MSCLCPRPLWLVLSFPTASLCKLLLSGSCFAHCPVGKVPPIPTPKRKESLPAERPCGREGAPHPDLSGLGTQSRGQPTTRLGAISVVSSFAPQISQPTKRLTKVSAPSTLAAEDSCWREDLREAFPFCVSLEKPMLCLGGFIKMEQNLWGGGQW